MAAFTALKLLYSPASRAATVTRSGDRYTLSDDYQTAARPELPIHLAIVRSKWQFVTSDNPCIVIGTKEVWGLAMPATPSLWLFVFDPQRLQWIGNSALGRSGVERIESLNQLQVRNRINNVYACRELRINGIVPPPKKPGHTDAGDPNSMSSPLFSVAGQMLGPTQLPRLFVAV